MPELNEIIHQTVRLRIMAVLVTIPPGEEVDFTYLRDLLEVTDGNLGAHLRKLEESGYITVNKAFVDWLGKREGEVLGREVIEVLGRDVFQLYRAYIDAALSGERFDPGGEYAFDLEGIIAAELWIGPRRPVPALALDLVRDAPAAYAMLRRAFGGTR